MKRRKTKHHKTKTGHNPAIRAAQALSIGTSTSVNLQAEFSEPLRPSKPYDEHLLEKAKTQWHFGDWQSLSQLDINALEQHPDRARLALLAAAGWLQLGHTAEARTLLATAEKWGCSRVLIARILIAGVHNNLARTATLMSDRGRAIQHFQDAIETGSPGNDSRLLMQGRVIQQYHQLGLSVTHLDLPVITPTVEAPALSC